MVVSTSAFRLAVEEREARCAKRVLAPALEILHLKHADSGRISGAFADIAAELS